jgi:hypothetical protein
VIGIGFGLPALYHPDEPAYVLQALAVGRGLPDGLTFADPPLFKYLLLAEDATAFGIGHLAGAYASPDAFVARFRADPGLLYLLARLTSALCGGATVVATLALGTLARNPQVGWIAASLATVTFLLVRESHFGVNDALLTLLVTLGLVGCLRIMQTGATRWYVVSGAALGLAFAAKYDGLVLLLPLVLAHVLGAHRTRWRRLVLAGVVGLMAAIVTFPSLVIEPGRVLADVDLHDWQPARIGYDGLDPDGAVAYYVKALGWGLGWPLVLAVVGGLILTLIRRDRRLAVVASLPLAMALVLGSQRLFFVRLLLPAVPALLVLAAAATEVVLGRVRPDRQPAARIALVVLLAIGPLLSTLRFDWLLTRTDTRALAQLWLARELPAGAPLAVDAAPVAPDVGTLGRTVVLAPDGILDSLDLDAYRERGVRYVVTSSFSADVRRVDSAEEQHRQRFYADLIRRGTVLARFGPDVPFVYDDLYGPFTALDARDQPGPTITVYELPST